MNIDLEIVSDVGLVRSNNEDMALFNGLFIRDDILRLSVETGAEQSLLFAIADGMGGHAGGELASELALKSLSSLITELEKGLSPVQLETILSAWVVRADKELKRYGDVHPEVWGLGTTLVALLLYENRFYLFHAGDSRMYRMRGGKLSRLTTDHSLAEMMHNKWTPRNIVTNCIGAGEEAYIDFADMTSEFGAGDILLLCSDGLSDMLSDSAITMLLNQGAGAEELVTAAKNNGGNDNITVLLASLSDSEP